MIGYIIVGLVCMVVGGFIGFTVTTVQELRAFTVGYTEGAGLDMQWEKMLPETREAYIEWVEVRETQSDSRDRMNPTDSEERNS